MCADYVQIGTDANASLLRSSLEAAGAKLQHLKEIPGPSGTAIIILQSNGGSRKTSGCHRVTHRSRPCEAHSDDHWMI